MAEPDALSFRQYRAGDEAQLVALFASVFGAPIDERHWLWKLRHPDSPAPNVLLALSGSRPVFQYAGIPLAFHLDGERALGMVSVDTMTAPDFRRRGLLTRVAGEAYSRWRDAGIQFVIGLPNEQWRSRTQALGWKPLFGLQRLVCPLRPEAALAHRLGLPWLRHLSAVSAAWRAWLSARVRRDASIDTRIVAEAGPEFDAMWEAGRECARFSVIRDRAWVRWRFLECPRRYQVMLASRDGVPVGYCAWRIDESQGRRRAFLAELFAVNQEPRVLHTLLADVLVVLGEKRAEYLLTLAPPATPLHRLLCATGFFTGAAFSVEMVPLAADLPLEPIARAENWLLSGAAFDVI